LELQGHYWRALSENEREEWNRVPDVENKKRKSVCEAANVPTQPARKKKKKGKGNL